MKIQSIGKVFNTNLAQPLKNNSSVFFKGQMENDVFIKAKKPTKAELKEQTRQALPEYLYHFTNKKAYESIMQSSTIKASKDTIDGVYMVDIEDYKKNWQTEILHDNVARTLLKQGLKDDNELVILKIPTSSLDPMKFVIRPQDEVIEFIHSREHMNLNIVYAEKGGLLNNKYALPKHIKNGYSPIKNKEFDAQGRPIEYIYKGNIDLKKLEGVQATHFTLDDLNEIIKKHQQ